MEEGHANRRGALSNSPRPAGAGTAELGAAKYGTAKVLKRTARAEAPLHVTARAPPGAPTLASHGLNVRCKKTNRATQRTNLLASVTL